MTIDFVPVPVVPHLKARSLRSWRRRVGGIWNGIYGINWYA